MVDKIATLEAQESAEIQFDSSNPQQVNEARKRSGRKKVQDRENYISLLEHENGRKFCWGFCASAIVGNPLVPNDPYSTYFNLGQERKAKDFFVELLRISPKLTALMVEENMDKK